MSHSSPADDFISLIDLLYAFRRHRRGEITGMPPHRRNRVKHPGILTRIN